MSARLTVTLKGWHKGLVVLAKSDGGELSALTYANLTQARKAAKACGGHVAGFHPFYVVPPADAPEVDDTHDDEYVCTRSGYDYCDGECSRCDERAAAQAEDNRDSRREEVQS